MFRKTQILKKAKSISLCSRALASTSGGSSGRGLHKLDRNLKLNINLPLAPIPTSSKGLAKTVFRGGGAARINFADQVGVVLPYDGILFTFNTYPVSSTEQTLCKGNPRAYSRENFEVYSYLKAILCILCYVELRRE